jgi:uncharacterized protein (TIGR00255 family)
VEVHIENRAEPGAEGSDVAEQANSYTLNLSAVAHYYESLKSAQKILGLEGQVGLKDVFVFPDVVQRSGADGSGGGIPDWGVLEPMFTDACRALTKERQREGAHLLDQLSGLVRGLRKGVDDLESLQAATRAEVQKRAKTRIEKALQGVTLDAAMNQRIAQETVLLIERSDVSEEIHRLKGHLNHFSELLGQGGAIGRKLEFLAQEILREINTLGSKSVELEMSRSALHSKSLADQVREQVLNLE